MTRETQPKKPAAKLVPIHVSLPKDIHARTAARAATESLSIGDIVRRVYVQAVEANPALLN